MLSFLSSVAWLRCNLTSAKQESGPQHSCCGQRGPHQLGPKEDFVLSPWAISKRRFSILVCYMFPLIGLLDFLKYFLSNICIIFVVTGWNTEGHCVKVI